MFQWKPTFPSKPCLPSEIQQKEDIECCCKFDPVHQRMNSGNSKEIANSSTSEICQMEELSSQNRKLQQDVHDLIINIPTLVQFSHELISMADNVRTKISKSIH